MRKLLSLARVLAQPKLNLLEPFVLSFRVLPTDMNLGQHMDNVRYLSIMDLARNEFFLRTGLMLTLLKQKRSIPMATSQVKYKRSLFALDRYAVHTQIIGWDEKWLIIEQQFISKGKIVTVGWFKFAILGREGRVSPAVVINQLLNTQAQAPELSSEIKTALAL